MSISSPPRTPLTPTHRRHPSSIDHTQWTNSPNRNLSRRSSTYSTRTRRSSGHGFPGADSLANEFEQMEGTDLGNLADELEGAWSEGEEGEGEVDFEDEVEDHLVEQVNGKEAYYVDGARDSGIVVSSPTAPPHKPISPTKGAPQRYMNDEGFSEDEESEMDESEMKIVTAELEARMATIESLAKRGLDSGGRTAIPEEGGVDEDAVGRFVEALRDLGAQSGLELSASRLGSAHQSLSTHLTSQSRVLSSLTSTLLSPLSSPPPPDMVAELLPVINATLASLPALSLGDGHSANPPLYALNALSNTTLDLIHLLSALSDTLQISRQTSTLASRRLRTCQDAMLMWKKEERRREEGIAWVESGGWDERLRTRDAAMVCSEVVGGFEEVCEGWRKRLFPQEVAAG